jgi:hypothetical protein
MTEGELGDLVLMGFPAGGSLIKRLLTNPDYRRLTSAVLLADATYTSSWDDPSRRIPPVMYGFDDYGVEATSDGSKLLISTASINPNKSWASGIENIQRLRQAIEERAGRSFQRLDHLYGVISPAGMVPEAVYQLGNVIFAEFSGASDFGHGHFKIQSQIWQRILIPWLEQGKGIIGGDGEQVTTSGLGAVTRYLPAAAGFAAGFIAVQLLTKG